MTHAVGQRGDGSAPKAIGSYVVLRRLGKGASSEVFEARDLRTGTHRAIKLFARSSPGDGFVREAGVGLELRHPNLLAAHDMGYLETGTRYVAFDLARGGSLRGRLSAPRQPIPFVRHVAVELGRALSVLHDAGLVHRDLKPENVLLASHDAFGRVKLGDLGTCEAVRQGPARGDVGSPAYMAPEQIEGACDTRADLYALGVLLYEMIVGGRPFVGTPKEVLDAHLGREPSFRAVPEPVASVLAKALAKKPERRYARVADFVSALDRALAEVAEGGPSGGASAAPESVVTLRGTDLVTDRASGWSLRRVSASHVALAADGAPREPSYTAPLALPMHGEGAVAASGLVRVALRDDTGVTLASDDETVRLAQPLYGLPPVVALRRIAGDAVTVEGGRAPAIVRYDERGKRLSSSALPVPVASIGVVATDTGEHVLGVDLQRRSVVAVHANAQGKKAQVLRADAEIATVCAQAGRVRVTFTSGAAAEVCADGDGVFHLLGWSSR